MFFAIRLLLSEVMDIWWLSAHLRHHQTLIHQDGEGSPRNCAVLHQLYVLRLDFDGGGDEAGYLDEEAARTGAANGEETSFYAVERTAYDAYAPTQHIGSDFFG